MPTSMSHNTYLGVHASEVHFLSIDWRLVYGRHTLDEILKIKPNSLNSFMVMLPLPSISSKLKHVRECLNKNSFSRWSYQSQSFLMLAAFESAQWTVGNSALWWRSECTSTHRIRRILSFRICLGQACPPNGSSELRLDLSSSCATAATWIGFLSMHAEILSIPEQS